MTKENQKEINQLKEQINQIKLEYENTIQQQKNYYEGMIALMPGHVYWLDKNNVYQGCNDLQAKAALLQSRQGIVGKTNFDLPCKEQAEELNKLNNLVMETGIAHTKEEFAMTADGAKIYLSHKVPIRDNNNDVVGLLGISFDISERKQMEEELRQAKEKAEAGNIAKTEFIANMSHDIRTPLTGILGLTQMLFNKLTNREDKQYAQWLHESSERLLLLLNNILDIVAADKMNEEEVYLEKFDIRKSIDLIGKLELPAIKVKNLELKITIDETVPHSIIGDKIKLHRILLNLLGNAIKFTEQGYVGINVKPLAQDNQQVTLQFDVIDSGIGIPKELHEKVFERFFRVATSYQGIYRGHGVGLYIVKKYVESLGGKINLNSKPGKGTIFSFILLFKIDEMTSPNKT